MRSQGEREISENDASTFGDLIIHAAKFMILKLKVLTKFPILTWHKNFVFLLRTLEELVWMLFMKKKWPNLGQYCLLLCVIKQIKRIIHRLISCSPCSTSPCSLGIPVAGILSLCKQILGFYEHMQEILKKITNNCKNKSVSECLKGWVTYRGFMHLMMGFVL